MRKILLFTSLLVTYISYANYSLAQIVPDNSLGLDKSTITSDTNINGFPSKLIQGGTARGSSLFHSFQEFSILSGQSAYFENPSGIQTILTRVTGGKTSRLLGRLGILGNADLFLLNPSGILFGPDSSLDLNGSFVATTANSILFDREYIFSANQPQPVPNLKISLPVGLQFGTGSQPISIQSSSLGLEVKPENTLAIVGGDININGGVLNAPGGNIELGSIGGNNQVRLKTISKGWELDYSNVKNFQDISISQRGSVSIPFPDGEGRLHIQGENLALSDGSQIVVNNSELLVDIQDTLEVKGFSEVMVPPELQTILGLKTLKSRSTIANEVFGTEDGNSTIINTKKLVLRNEGTITTRTSSILNGLTGELILGQARGGDLLINASESVEITNSGSALNSSTESAGQAGNIKINSPILRILDGGAITASSTSNTNALGLPIPTGPGGTIHINAPQAIILSGVSEETSRSSGLFSTSELGANGTGGKIEVITGSLSLSDGAVISTRTQSDFRGGDISISGKSLSLTSGGQILSSTIGSGNSGDITVRVIDQIKLKGRDPTFSERFDQIQILNDSQDAGLKLDPISAFSGIYANSEFASSGNAGSIDIDPKTVVIQDGAKISVSSRGLSESGNILLRAGNLTLDRGSISATSASGQGGNINLIINNLLFLTNNSQISASAGSQETGGDGGNITINTALLVALKNSDITANAFTGQGGDILVTIRGLFLSSDSDITASSERGINGVVTVSNPEVDPTNSLTEIPESVDSPKEVVQGCRTHQTSNNSTFVNVGRGGLPPGPYEAQTPKTVWQDLRTHNMQPKSPLLEPATTSHNTSTSVPEIIEAKGWTKDSLGHIRLTANISQRSQNPFLTLGKC